MLKKRIIPTLLWKNFTLVKGKSFDSWRRVGTVLPAVIVYNTRDCDELIIVDIEASIKNTEIDFDSIRDFSSECNVPLTIGGGIKNIKQIQQLLRSGADKVSINTYAYSDISLIKNSSKEFGTQCIVSSVDFKFNQDKKIYECFSHSGTRNTGINILDWVRKLEDHGAGEIILTSIERDGTMSGYDCEIIEKIVEKVNVPIIASGGCGNYNHMFEVFMTGVSAVAAASIFHFTQQTPLEAKKYLIEKNIPMRR